MDRLNRRRFLGFAGASGISLAAITGCVMPRSGADSPELNTSKPTVAPAVAFRLPVTVNVPRTSSTPPLAAVRFPCTNPFTFNVPTFDTTNPSAPVNVLVMLLVRKPSPPATVSVLNVFEFPLTLNIPS